MKVETDRPNNEVTAGEPINLKLTVTNHGTTPLYRLFGVTKSENPLFDNKELVIGKLEPGKSRTVTVPAGWCDFKGHKVGLDGAAAEGRAARSARSPRTRSCASDGVKVHFEEARGRAPADAELRATVKSLERPIFAYSYEVIDNRRGNGDGRVQKGEDLTMYLTVKNVGKGRSFETHGEPAQPLGRRPAPARRALRHLEHDAGRHEARGLHVRRRPRLADPEAKVELSIHDEDLREGVVEKVRIPIADRDDGRGEQRRAARRASGADLRQRAGRAGPRRSRGCRRGRRGASLGNVQRVREAESRATGASRSPARAELEQGGAAPAQVAIEDSMGHAPPALELPQPQLATRDAHTQVHGTASDDARLLDAFIFVGARKVFYHSNRNGADPKKMSFDADLPLRPGVNVVTVVARENPDTTTRRTYIVRRDGPNGELLRDAEDGRRAQRDGLGRRRLRSRAADASGFTSTSTTSPRSATRAARPIRTPSRGAEECLAAGADGITAHLREDRRHIVDDDVARLARSARGRARTFNLEMAATDEMVGIAAPREARRVHARARAPRGAHDRGRARRRARAARRSRAAVAALAARRHQGEPLHRGRRGARSTARARSARAQVELHTGEYAHGRAGELARLAAGARRAHAAGLEVAAGHGLTQGNVPALVALPEIVELNIGHAVIGDAVFVGPAARPCAPTETPSRAACGLAAPYDSANSKKRGEPLRPLRPLRLSSPLLP